MTFEKYDLPDLRGHFGPYGGRFVAEALMAVIEEVTAAYEKARKWIIANPAETAKPGYDIDTVMATPAKMKRIVAVRLALVLRDTNYEKDMVAPTTLISSTGTRPLPLSNSRSFSSVSSAFRMAELALNTSSRKAMLAVGR